MYEHYIVIKERNLSARNFGFVADSNSFILGNEYLWSDKEVDIPAKIDFTFTFENKGELIPCFSQNKGSYPYSDALSWYFATDGHAFTFRKDMFSFFNSND